MNMFLLTRWIIIVVSSSEDPDTINQCFQSGAEDFLQKPVQLEILKRRVNMCLEDRLRRRKEKAYQEMLQNERINRKKLTLRVKEQEKELEEIKNQINNTVETPMQVVMKTIADLMEGKYSIENSKGALIAVLRSLGSKDLYKPAFSNLLRKGELDDSTRRWLQTEFMNEGDNNVNGNKSNTPISNESSPTTEKNSQQTKEQSQSSSASNQQVSLYHKQVDDIVTKNTLPGDLGSHTFDTLKYSHDQLIQFIVQMFENLGLIETFKIPPKELVDLLTVVRESYKHNPYHNFTHAVDVTQFAYHLLLVDRISQMFSPMEKFALMFSAIMHDVGHPGVNNNYLINIKDELALIYNDVSVLENHHASQAFYLLLKHNICSNLSKDEFKEFRRLVISTILCTDMSHHFEILTKFQTRLQTGTLSKESKEDRLQLMGVILKCSDVSNALRPFDVSEKWSNVLLEEFFLQGDSERDCGLPISPLMDRRSVDKPKSQLNFIDYIAAPLFNNLITYCSCLNTTLGETLQKNRSLWEERAQAASGMGSNQQKEDISSTHTTTTTKNTITTTTTTKTSTTTTTTNSQEKPVLTGSMPSHFAKAKGFTILIIDDESAQCAKKLEQPLLSLSYTVVSTTLAKTESELVKSKADIILLNYDIVQSTELVQKIRLVSPIIPIITISSNSVQTDWCQQSFVRPVDTTALIHSVEHHIELSLDRVQPIDLEIALEQTGGDEEFLWDMLNELIGAGSEQIEKIKQSTKTLDWASMELNSHSLKGSSAQLACKPLSQAALSVETSSKNQDSANLEQKIALIEKRLNDLANFVQKHQQQ